MRTFTEEEKKQIADGYRGGVTIKQLQRLHKCGRAWIHAVLKEARVQRRPSGWYWRNRVAERSANWKGGIRIHVGRGRVRLNREHPHADSGGYVAEHRLVMEKILGRFLRPEEVVHHINGDTLDNRPENLMLFADQSAHKKHHMERGDQLRNAAGQFRR